MASGQFAAVATYNDAGYAAGMAQAEARAKKHAQAIADHATKKMDELEAKRKAIGDKRARQMESEAEREVSILTGIAAKKKAIDDKRLATETDAAQKRIADAEAAYNKETAAATAHANKKKEVVAQAEATNTRVQLRAIDAVNAKNAESVAKFKANEEEKAAAARRAARARISFQAGNLFTAIRGYNEANQAYKASMWQTVMQRPIDDLAKKTERGGDALNKFAGVAMTAVGSLYALQKVTQSFDTYVQANREIVEKTKTDQDKALEFIALQPEGKRKERVDQINNLSVTYGITEGNIYDIVQAMQSQYGGDFSKGIEASKAVFMLRQIGIPIEKAMEAMRFEKQLGFKWIGELGALETVVGQETSRSPAGLIASAAGLTFWKNKYLGASMAGVIGGASPEEWIGTYSKAAAWALGPSGGTADYFKKHGLAGKHQGEKAKWLKEQGIDNVEEMIQSGVLSQEDFNTVLSTMAQPGKASITKGQNVGVDQFLKAAGLQDASEIERLDYLYRHGVQSVADLEKIGVTERREVGSLGIGLPNWAEVMRVYGETRRVQPGLVENLRMGMEEEVPQLRQQRERDYLTRFRDRTMAWGPMSTIAGEQDIEMLRRGAALQEQALTQVGAAKLIDDSGRMTSTAPGLIMFQDVLARIPGIRKLAGSPQVGQMREMEQGANVLEKGFDRTTDLILEKGKTYAPGPLPPDYIPVEGIPPRNTIELTLPKEAQDRLNEIAENTRQQIKTPPVIVWGIGDSDNAPSRDRDAALSGAY